MIFRNYYIVLSNKLATICDFRQETTIEILAIIIWFLATTCIIWATNIARQLALSEQLTLQF
jgi:hypothetical protein